MLIDNVAAAGGVIYSFSGPPTLVDCTMSGNTAVRGGAVCAEMYVITCIGCTITENSAVEGAGLMSWIGYTLERTLIAFNHDGPGLWPEIRGSHEIVCCDIFGNEGGDWIGPFADFHSQDGNLCVDPQFCSVTPNEDQDWGLQSDSPCVPGQAVCGLIGAWDVGCAGTAVEATS